MAPAAVIARIVSANLQRIQAKGPISVAPTVMALCIGTATGIATIVATKSIQMRLITTA